MPVGWLGEFSDRIESFTEVDADGRAQSTLFRDAAQSGGTALYDSISFALCMLRSARYPRQVLVVATDGADQHSRLRLAQLIEAAQASRAR